MKRQRIIASTLVFAAGLCAYAPPAALSAGPLLSGYGGPGAGTQAILGSTLIGGGGSQGGGSQGSGSQAGGATTVAPGSGSQVGGRTQGARAGRSDGHSRSASELSSATPPRAAGATPSISSPEDASSTSVSWFSRSDTLAVALAAAALLLVGIATVRLARTEHD